MPNRCSIGDLMVSVKLKDKDIEIVVSGESVNRFLVLAMSSASSNTVLVSVQEPVNQDHPITDSPLVKQVN